MGVDVSDRWLATKMYCSVIEEVAVRVGTG